MSLAVRIQKRFSSGAESAAFLLDVEFQAAAGITVLFGPSGAGKSLTLDCIAGFQRPDAGRILLAEQILYDGAARVNLRPQRRECGYVFQNQALFPHMTVRENLMFAAERRPRLERHRRVGETLERFRLTDLAGRKPGQISGGQRQRCAIARALLAAPRALLMDEPATGLDAALRGELADVLRDLRGTLEIPVLLVTHDIDEAVTLGDAMLVYSAGAIVQRGTPEGVLARPGAAEAARLLGPVNIFEAEILALDPGRNTSRVRVNGSELTGLYLPGHLIGDHVQMAARPHELRAHVLPGENRVAMRLERATELTNFVELRFTSSFMVLAARGDYDAHRDRREFYVEFPAGALRPLGDAG